jgi:hypothetical protein
VGATNSVTLADADGDADAKVGTDPDATADAPRWMRRAMVWRSPADQPVWARPVLLGLAVLAGLAYRWHMGSSIEISYAAAVRSMSMRWHDFVYAAAMVDRGAFHVVLTAPTSTDPRVTWVTLHCLKAPSPPSAPGSGVVVAVAVHFCVPPR